MTESADTPEDKALARHGPEDLAPLRQKTIVLVGLMGVGKSSVGRGWRRP